MDALASDDDTSDRLGSLTQLLHQAAIQIWDQADEGSPWQSLGLGVYLAQAQASALLPEGRPLPQLDVEYLEGQTVLQLLTAAEGLTRALPAHCPDLDNRSQLALDLCDLIREARNLGC